MTRDRSSISSQSGLLRGLTPQSPSLASPLGVVASAMAGDLLRVPQPPFAEIGALLLQQGLMALRIGPDALHRPTLVFVDLVAVGPPFLVGPSLLPPDDQGGLGRPLSPCRSRGG